VLTAEMQDIIASSNEIAALGDTESVRRSIDACESLGDTLDLEDERAVLTSSPWPDVNETYRRALAELRTLVTLCVQFQLREGGPHLVLATQLMESAGMRVSAALADES
jgi:hypothetical protein